MFVALSLISAHAFSTTKLWDLAFGLVSYKGTAQLAKHHHEVWEHHVDCDAHYFEIGLHTLT